MEAKDKIELPKGFEEMVRGVIGDGEWDAFVDALSEEPSVSVRVNGQRSTVDGQQLEGDCFDNQTSQTSRTSPTIQADWICGTQLSTVKWCEWGRYLAERPKFTYDPMFHAGAYYVQEASSMFVWQALEQLVERDAVVLDMCAAPGGKSTAIAQYLSEEGFLVSNEYVPQRAHVLVENITKWGAPNCVVTNNAPRHFEKLKVKFDAILVDAPCSGEGMFRKDERAREEWSRANVEMCVERQREILESAWEVLKPGGVLIYSTCTFNSHENEEQVQWLIDEMEAEYLPLKIGEDWMITETERGYRFLPHKTRGEGLFMAAVRKQGGIRNEELGMRNEKMEKNKKDKKAKNSTFNSQLSTLNLLRGDYGVVESEGRYYAVQKESLGLVEECRKALNVLMFGVQMYEQKGKDLIPQAALALSQVYERGAYPEVELSYEEAISFLRKEAIVLADAPRGFVLVTYGGLPLGWVKNIGNRCNNLYPEFWRIRN
ncbi:MAG: rRNA cytosine-C5-methyltransferase [Paludibacteraceae bacterium]|nr:rRNA cytosine-C5-methyltransferase [Paludibacteraceae bacterium]